MKRTLSASLCWPFQRSPALSFPILYFRVAYTGYILIPPSPTPCLHKISIKFCFKCSWEDCIFLRAFENNNWGRGGGGKRKISLPSRPFRFYYGGGILKSRSFTIFYNFLILHVDSNSSALPISFHSFQGILLQNHVLCYFQLLLCTDVNEYLLFFFICM